VQRERDQNGEGGRVSVPFAEGTQREQVGEVRAEVSRKTKRGRVTGKKEESQRERE
jgi:hypothetical protein